MINAKLKALLLEQDNYESISDDALKLSISENLSRPLDNDPELVKKLKGYVQASATSLILNPFNVEKLMSESIDIVKSLIQQRTTVQNLEVLLVTDPLSKGQVAARRAFEDEMVKIEKGFTNSGKVLSKQWKWKKNATAVEADPGSISEISSMESSIFKAKEKYIQQVREYEDFLIDHSHQTESGLNYLVRYDREKTIYFNDFAELYLKLISLQEGLASVYDFDFSKKPLPPPEICNLNNLYIWIKENALLLSKLLERSVEFTLIIPLQSSFSIWNQEFKILDEGIYQRQLKKHSRLQFTLPPSLLAQYKSVRLRGVGVKLRYNPSSQEDDYWIQEVKNIIQINLPVQTLKNGMTYTLPQLTLTATNNRNQLEDFAQVDNNSYININPFNNALWEVMVGIKNLSPQPRGWDLLRQTYLVLDLAALG